MIDLIIVTLLSIIAVLCISILALFLNFWKLEREYQKEIKNLIADYSETLSNVVSSRAEDWEHIHKLTKIANEAVMAAQFYADKYAELQDDIDEE